MEIRGNLRTMGVLAALMVASGCKSEPSDLAGHDTGSPGADTGGHDLDPQHGDLERTDSGSGPAGCCGSTTHSLGGTPTDYLAPFPSKSLAAQKAGGVDVKDTTCVDLKKFYLTRGPQTQITTKVKEILAKVTATTRPEIITAILKLLRDKTVFPCTAAQKKALSYNETAKSYPDKVKRGRTVDQIIKGGCMTGCTDFTLVFATLARGKGIPATVTETISEKWVYEMVQKNKWNPAKKGHFYSAVFVGGKWVVYDPTRGVKSPRSSKGYYSLNNERYLLFARGLDSWDYGIKTMAAFSQQVKERFYIAGAQPKD